eukprot:sb/3477593/
MSVFSLAVLFLCTVTATFSLNKDDFAKLMEDKNPDLSILNTLEKDKCLQNRAACLEWVKEQHDKLKDIIGRVYMDKFGQPKAEIPDSLLYEEELLVEDGADSPYPSD